MYSYAFHIYSDMLLWSHNSTHLWWWIWCFNHNIKLVIISLHLVLIPHLKTCLPTHIILLCWESTNAHAGGVRFDDAVYAADVRWGHAKAGAHSPHSAVRRRHKGIRPWTKKHLLNRGGENTESVFLINSTNPVLLTEVNIQQSGVGSLHQDLLTGPSERFVHEVHPISHQRTQPLSIDLRKHMDSLEMMGNDSDTIFLRNCRIFPPHSSHIDL